MAQLEITLKKGLAGQTVSQRSTVQALGLRKVGQTVVQPDNEATRGAVTKVQHLLEVKEINE